MRQAASAGASTVPVQPRQEFAKMDVREAVALAKKYVTEIFVDEKISELGLEEVEYDENSQSWLVTIGFSRPWQRQDTMILVGGKKQRDYKVIRISDTTKKMVSVKNREPAT